jgi:uncharacterized protein
MHDLAWIPGLNTASRVPVGIKALTRIMEASVQLATNSEHVHQRILITAMSTNSDKSFPYHRFNVERDMDAVGLEEWRKMEAIGQHTARYMEEGEGEMKKNRCVHDLMQGFDVDARNRHTETALIVAVNKGDIPAVRVLLELGADVNVENNSGLSPLYVAAMRGHEDIARMLLEAGANVKARKKDGTTALIRAAASGHQGLVSLLLDNGSHIDEKDNLGRTSLMWAASQGGEPVVRLLLSRGANVNIHSSGIGDGALHRACIKGCISTVRLLVDCGADVDSAGIKGSTPLMWAAKKGYEAVVQFLLAKGAKVDCKDDEGATAITVAAVEGHDGIVRLLLAKCLDKKEIIDAKSNGLTPLHLAIMKGHERVVGSLLNGGASVESKFISGSGEQFNMLHLAADTGHKGIVRMLLDKGAEWNAKNGVGATALDLARNQGHMEVVLLLQDFARRNRTWYGRRRT